MDMTGKQLSQGKKNRNRKEQENSDEIELQNSISLISENVTFSFKSKQILI